MPTFRNWKTESGYGVVANLPNAPHPFTYQLKPRAVEFYKELGYENHSKIDGRLVWPLRKLGDLYIKGEEKLAGNEIKDVPTLGELDKFSFTDSEKRALAQYISDHPLFTPNIEKELKTSFAEYISLDKINEINNNNTNLAAETIDSISGQMVKTTHQSVEYCGSDVGDYLKTISEISNIENSIREFVDHPYRVTSLSIGRTYLSYSLDVPHWPDLLFECADRRSDQSNVDFEVESWISESRIEKCHTDTIYMCEVIDGYTTNWELHSDYGRKIKHSELTPSDCSNVIYDQSRILGEIVSLFGPINSYEVYDPS